MNNKTIAPNIIVHADSIRFGVLMIVIATFTMALQDTIVKLISSTLPLWQLFTLRSLIVLPLLFVLHRITGKDSKVGPKLVGWAILRGTLLVLMYVAFYASLPLLDLSIVAAAYYTGPLLITLFSALLIGERVGTKRLFAVGVGFFGVLVVLQPGTESFSWPMLIPIASAIFYAFSAILTRSKCRQESPLALSLVLNYCFIVFGVVMTIYLLLWQPSVEQQAVYPFLLGDWVPLDRESVVLLSILAAANIAIHIALAHAYQSAPSTIVATFDYSYLLFAAAWAYLLLNEVPGVTTLVGMAMVVTAGILSIWQRKT